MIKNFLWKLVGVGTSTESETECIPPKSAQECNAILRKARQEYAERKYDLCISEIFPLIQSNPEIGEAHFLAGKSLYGIKDFGAAANALKKAADLGMSDPSTDAMIASCLTDIGEIEQALVYALKAHEKRKTDPQICLLMAQLYYRKELYVQAATFYSKALALSPRSFDALIGLVSLNTLAQLILRRNLITSQVLNTKKYYLKKMQSELRDLSSLTEQELHNLLVLAADDGDIFNEIAVPCASELYRRSNLDAQMALSLARFFYTVGDKTKSIELFVYCQERVSSFNLVPSISLGNLYISLGGKKWDEGWRVFDQAFLAMYSSKKVDTVPLWKGENLSGKRLFVYQEQGVGDLLLGIRVFRKLKEKGISSTFCVGKGLGDLFKTAGCLDKIVENEYRPDPRDCGCDVAIPLFSLIRVLKLSSKEIKSPVFVRSLPGRCEAWRERILALPGLRVGLVTTGNPWRADDWTRSVLADDLNPLGNVQSISWVNLAFDERPERDAIVKKFSAVNPAGDMKDFADTAAIIDTLDAVVAIDCSVAHLAAALGKPVFVLVPTFVDWRWRVGDDTQPWWPNAKTFFSPFPGKWELPVKQLTESLTQFAQIRMSAN